jgi:beta-glucosidase
VLPPSRTARARRALADLRVARPYRGACRAAPSATYSAGNRLGITLNLYPAAAASDDPADLEAARRIDGTQNRLFLDPVLRDGYPADVLGRYEPLAGLDHIHPGDEAVIGTPIDVLGVNYYQRHVVAAGPAGQGADPGATEYPTAEDVLFVPRDGPRTANGWSVDAGGLLDLLLWRTAPTRRSHWR